MQHIEFVHKDHFQHYYHRFFPSGKLSLFIDFFWETHFDSLWKKYQQGFSDVLFPNLGYTYLINLGTPFQMQVGEQITSLKGDGFLPRLSHIEAFHREGNCVFGVKFRVSPVMFEKNINFSEYNGTVFPLSYLMDKSLLGKIKEADSFEKRVQLISHFYENMLERYQGSLLPIEIVTSVVKNCIQQNSFTIPVEQLSEQYGVSSRTLQRYFERCTGVSSKQALQVLRIRRAVSHIINSPQTFHYGVYGYYDYSHFYKHLKQFLQKDTLEHLRPHLQLLLALRRKEG